jgi:tetratricopeptide (TPR) repeat protein
MRELAAALALSAAVNLAPRPAVAPRPLPRLAPDTAIETATLLSLGMRRLAADLELVRLLVYYGSAEPSIPENRLENGGGQYPEIGPRSRRILELDPSFSFAVLYGAGALAFNLDRPDEALELVASALERDPRNLEYRAYAGAIGFHRKGDTARALALLEPMLSQADCPTMIKSMVAFMYKRSGRRAEAVRVYRDILRTSRDAGYRATARNMLRELGAAP